MKKLILTLFTAIAFISVQAQCNSNRPEKNFRYLLFKYKL